MTFEQSEAAYAASITFEQYRKEVTEIVEEVLCDLEDMDQLDEVLDDVALPLVNWHHWVGSVHTALAILRHSPNANHAFQEGLDIAHDDWRLFNRRLAVWAMMADVRDAITDPSSSLAI